jgi:hypothetical protein
MAIQLSQDTGISVQQAQQDILDGWKETVDSSINRGEYVHDAFERYAIKGEVEEDMKKPIAYLSELLKNYYRYYPEQLLYSHNHKVAGRTDMVLQRQKSKNPIYDLLDYKSNESKGIVFDSIRRKSLPWKHINKYFLAPFDYLEDCNYTRYAFQLSIYAFLMMTRLNFKIGKLWILFVDNDFDIHYYPVPFMYQEAKMICELNTSRKQLPISNYIQDHNINTGWPTLDAFNKKEMSTIDLNNIKEDW